MGANQSSQFPGAGGPPGDGKSGDKKDKVRNDLKNHVCFRD